MEMVEKVIAGDKLSVSRSISMVENEVPEAEELMKALYSHTGGAHIIGITGPPGAGKSTTTDKLIKMYRERGKKVGVVAIDPTSPYSGGAILGDRIRMMDVSMDAGVFIRSMATRGSLGGLSAKTTDAVKILDAAGNLVFETNVKEGQELYGGKVVWNKTNLAGKKVASGVYIVLLSSNEGTETSITKIAIIN